MSRAYFRNPHHATGFWLSVTAFIANGSGDLFDSWLVYFRSSWWVKTIFSFPVIYFFEAR